MCQVSLRRKSFFLSFFPSAFLSFFRSFLSLVYLFVHSIHNCFDMTATDTASNVTLQEKLIQVVYLQKAFRQHGAENEYSDLCADRNSLVGAHKCNVCLQNQ